MIDNGAKNYISAILFFMICFYSIIYFFFATILFLLVHCDYDANSNMEIDKRCITMGIFVIYRYVYNVTRICL
jgi:hypothetical protein